MRHGKTIATLVLCIVVLASIATTVGVFSENGSGTYAYTSIRGETVMIYGKGLYRHMSAEVAPQGIGQDVVTMVLGIPLLLLSLVWAGRGSLRGKYLLTGTLGYFMVTYLFYTCMGMYNELFLVYVLLLAASFYGFLLSVLSFKVKKLRNSFSDAMPVKFIGGFLIFSAVAIGLLWLQIIVPHFLHGTIPQQVEHYTTLIVQGLDLGILLPAAFISGVLLIQRQDAGYLLAPVYSVFLAILMTALTAKVVAMALAGFSVFPVVIIIPLLNLIAVVSAVLAIKSIREKRGEQGMMKVQDKFISVGRISMA